MASRLGVGGGHMMRSMSLASAMIQYVNIHFVLDQEDEFWLSRLENKGFTGEVSKDSNNFQLKLQVKLNCIGVLVDSYDISRDTLLNWKEQCGKLAVIDDFNDAPDFSDFIISSSVDKYVENKNHAQIIMQGPEYALLSPEYYNHKPKKSNYLTINTILISFGFYDSKNCTELVINALKETKFDGMVQIAIGSKAPYILKIKKKLLNYLFDIEIYEDMDGLYELNSKADLIIGSGGVSLLERMTLGKPSITFIVANNQERQVKWAASLGATIQISLNKKNLKRCMVNTINTFLLNANIRNNMSKISAEAVDAKGALRVSKILTSGIK